MHYLYSLISFLPLPDQDQALAEYARRLLPNYNSYFYCISSCLIR